MIKSNKSTLKIQQRFKSEKHNAFTEEINKIALSSNDYISYVTIKWNDTNMINFDDVINENIK